MIFKKKKPETEEERSIRYADTIIAHSDFKGELNTDCLDPQLELWVMRPIVLPHELRLIRNEIHSLEPKNYDGTTVDIEVTKRYISDNYSVVRNHLLNYGYINTPDHTQKWILNDKGKLMKELGGHKKYISHRRREINILKNQNFINWCLIIATGAAAVMPFIAAWLFTTKVYNTNDLPESAYRPDIRIDSVWLQKQVDDAIYKRLSSRQPSDTIKL